MEIKHIKIPLSMVNQLKFRFSPGNIHICYVHESVEHFYNHLFLNIIFAIQLSNICHVIKHSSPIKLYIYNIHIYVYTCFFLFVPISRLDFIHSIILIRKRTGTILCACDKINYKLSQKQLLS